MAAQLLRRSQQVGCLQVLSNDSVQDDAKHNLDVGGVCCRGEVGIDDLLLVEVALHELTLNEPTGSLHITIWTCTTQGERGEKVGEVVRGISQKQENDIREGLEEKLEKKWHGNTVASSIQPHAVTQDYPTPPSTSLHAVTQDYPTPPSTSLHAVTQDYPTPPSTSLHAVTQDYPTPPSTSLHAVTQDYPTPPSTSLLKDTHIHRCLYTSHSTNIERVGRGWYISLIVRPVYWEK